MNSLPWGSIVPNDKSKVCMSAAAAGIISLGWCVSGPIWTGRIATTNSSFLFGFWAKKMSERWRRLLRAAEAIFVASKWEERRQKRRAAAAAKRDIFQEEWRSLHHQEWPKMCVLVMNFQTRSGPWVEIFS